MKCLTGHKRTCIVNSEEEYKAVEQGMFYLPKFLSGKISLAVNQLRYLKEVERTIKSLRINKLSNDFSLNVFDALS